MRTEASFATSADGTRIAWSRHGSGPPLVRVGTWLTHRDETGKAWCWGWGYLGRLSDGDTSFHGQDTSFAVVDGHTFTRLTAGGLHTSGVDSAGTGWCWGYGQYGQLGDGNADDHFTGVPVEVMGGHTVSRLTAQEGFDRPARNRRAVGHGATANCHCGTKSVTSDNCVAGSDR